MSRENLRESLSAVMDDEADELELRRVLAASEGGDMRETWARYQLARAAMHKELILPDLDIAAAVSARLADEPVVAQAQKAPRWRAAARVAVAASVTLAVLAGVRLYNQDELNGVQLAQQQPMPSLSMPKVQGLALLAGYSPDEAEQIQADARVDEENWHIQRLPGYMRQHAQAAPLGAESALPYARASSLENQ